MDGLLFLLHEDSHFVGRGGVTIVRLPSPSSHVTTAAALSGAVAVLATFAIGAALVACGGENADATPGTHAPPRMPPSMAGGGDDDAPDAAAAQQAQSAAAPGASAASGALTHPPSADVSRGIKALDAGDLVTAKAAFDSARTKDPKDADAAYFAGVIADRNGDAKTAEARFRDALAITPGHAAASVDLAAVLTESKRDDEAATVCRAAIAKHPENSALHVNLAEALASKGDQAGATSEFEAAIKQDKDQPMYFLSYGHWLGAWNKPNDAIAKFNAARAVAGGDVAVLASIAHEMFPLKDFADCVATLDEAIGVKDAAELRTERAACKIAQGDEPGGLADLNAATTNEPSFAPAHFLLAARLAKAGDKAGAIRQYQMYIKLEPTAPNAKVAATRIKALNAKP